jgi:tetratricopeptide (TPR) repeat protein
MPNKSSDDLFQLILSLQKAEKRNFKLYIRRNSSSEDLKIVQLFDAMDKMKQYDENVLLKKVPSIKKQQLPNIKAHLYKQVLASLRLLRNDDNIDIHLHQQLDYARILYNKGLYLQSLTILERLKEVARSYNQDSFLIQIISLEKKIEILHITRSLEGRADQLSAEANEINEKRQVITSMSNLALQLYSWYIRNGHARNEKDEKEIREFFYDRLPSNAFSLKGFYEKLYLYQSYCWFAFIRQDFLQYYRYTQKWVDLFKNEPLMIQVETGHYIKGVHNLLNAHFDLRNYQKFTETLNEFESFTSSDLVSKNQNNRIQSFIYLTTAEMNQHFLLGTFEEGHHLVPYIEEKLVEYGNFIDRHRVLVFYYKIANLYFGSGDYSKCIDYLHKIINWNVDLRNDLQCYARILHLLAHYEMGNFEIIDPLVRSVYRFLKKMETVSIIEEEIFAFLKKNFHLSPRKLQPEFAKLLEAIRKHENNRFATRSFAYLDLIAWLQAKVEGRSLSAVIKDRYQASKRAIAAPKASSKKTQPSLAVGTATA